MKNAFKHISWFFKQEWKLYVLCLILLVFVSVVPLIPAKVLGAAIDSFSTGTLTLNSLLMYVLLLFLCPILTYLVNIFYHYTMIKLGHKLSYQLREKYISHLFDMDSELYEKYTKGDLISRATNDLNSLTTLATTFLENVIFYAVTIITAIVMMIIISPLLTLASVAFMPLVIFFLNKARLEKRKYYKKHHEIYAEMTESVLESIEGVKTVRAYCYEDEDFKKTERAIINDVDSWWKIQKFESAFTPLFELVYALAYFIAIGLGTYLVIHGDISAGSLVSYLVYVGTLYAPLIGLSNVLNIMNNIVIADQRFNEVMNTIPSVKNEEHPKDILKFKEISFNNASFKYPFDDFEVIKNITFSIKSGETIGIVGPTGSGKSTLIRQLLREFNLTSGEIKIDGNDIKEYKIEDIRNLVGYVPQNHILFRRSVDDNILIGKPDANSQALQKAMTMADFKKDLSNLAEGSSTMVAELGESLSGGQKQRLSIARALVKDPEILILDDSLSAVDALTESTIIEQLKEDRKDKTNIIVAHRFSAVKNADKIIVLQDGVITDMGSSKELLKYDNWYKLQYLKQLKGDIYE
ncbi:MAG: ABC transporter ATP-binding protein [Bacilli bacterium]|nr:ABC transporter ATP-binding protein [Bacilli bacterium]